MPPDDRTRISTSPGPVGDGAKTVKARIVFDRRMGKPVRGEEITLIFGAQLMVGREKSCDIYINDDRVSRKHAQVRIDPDAFRLSDLGSTNGTSRNGEKLSEEIILSSGDHLNFGQAKTYQVRLVEREGMLSSVRLVSGKEALILAAQEIVIGFADPQNLDTDLMIYDPSIAPHHARIEVFAGQTFIVALDPQHPLLVNSRPTREIEIKNNYLIELGDTLFRYELVT